MPEEGRFSQFPTERSTTLPLGTANVNELLSKLRRTGDIEIPTINLKSHLAFIRALDADISPQTLYDSLKPWRVTLQSYFLGDIAQRVNTFRAENPPYGLIQNEFDEEYGLPQNPDSFLGTFTLGSRRTWDAAVDDWHQPLERWVNTIPEADLLHLNPAEFTMDQRLFAKFWYVTRIARKELSLPKGTPKTEIESGIGTAVRWAPRVTELNAQVYMRDIYDDSVNDEEHIRRMADTRRTYPLTAWLASMHVDHGIPLIDAFVGQASHGIYPGDSRYDTIVLPPGDFEYASVPQGDVPFLVPRVDATQLRDKEGLIIFDHRVNSIRTLCSGLYASIAQDDGQSNIINYQLSWAADVAENMLFPQLLERR